MNKKTFTPNKRQAFSLIELSIVLIIIGLLIAGVTGGASLIKNAELRKITEEARGYQTAVNSFYAKYNALPGDFGTVIGTTVPVGSVGNADGLISFINGGATNVGRAEANLAWQVLKSDNFINESFTAATADLTGSSPAATLVASTPGTNVPASKSKGGAWIFDNITVNSATQNVVIISTGTNAVANGTNSIAQTASANMTAGTASTATGNAQLLPTDALSIDNKVDDGVPNTGKVSTLLNGNIAGIATCGTNGLNPGSGGTTQCTSCTGNSNAPGTFATSTSFKSCALAFQVDPNS